MTCTGSAATRTPGAAMRRIFAAGSLLLGLGALSCTSRQRSGTAPEGTARDSVDVLVRLIQRSPTSSPREADELARRQADAALSLASRGRSDLVWPLFRHRRDPDMRSYLVHGLASRDMDP